MEGEKGVEGEDRVEDARSGNCSKSTVVQLGCLALLTFLLTKPQLVLVNSLTQPDASYFATQLGLHTGLAFSSWSPWPVGCQAARHYSL